MGTYTGQVKGRIDAEGRECSQCRPYKLWAEFSPCTYSRTGYMSACRLCRNQRGQDKRDSQRFIRAGAGTGQGLSDSGVLVERREYRARTGRVSTCKSYGITEEQYAWLLEQQGGKCALCLNPETHQHPRWTTICSLSIDHDHACDKHDLKKKGCPSCIRGLLCRNCNHMLGLAERSGSAALLVRFEDYLALRPFRTLWGEVVR